MKFRPREDYLLVRPLERKKSSILHVISRERFSRGFIVSVGPGRPVTKKFDGRIVDTGRITPLVVKPGDFITFQGDYDLFPEYVEDGINYRILQEADITFLCDPEHASVNMSDEEVRALVEEAKKPLELAA